MYSHEERIRAVKLYIELGKRSTATIPLRARESEARARKSAVGVGSGRVAEGHLQGQPRRR